MKKTLLSLFTLFATTLLFAQTTITNGTMESWDNVGGNTEEPSRWNSNKTGGGNATSGPQTCFREATNPHGGTYCARVKTGLAFGIVVVNGSLTTGKVEAPTTNKSEGYIRTIPITPTDSTYGMRFIGRPDSLVFWYRYDSYSSDYPRVEARLHVGYAYAPEAPVGGNHPDSTVNIVARAQWTNAPTSDISTWTRVSMPFVYVDSRTPQYILITTTSSGNQTGGTNNSTLWLDDFEAIYNPTIATGTISPLTYYVSAATGASITVPFTLGGTFTAGNTVTAQLSDASGSFASAVNIGSANTTTSGTVNATIPANTAAGTQYRVRVISSTPALTASANTSDITIVAVSNFIAPGSTQTIAANANGTLLNVTETAGAVSREWKYATSAGGPYQSFGTAQTGATYTPNFAAAGTYYVVAVTTYPGNLTVTSNEVQVNVVGNEITPAAPQSILVSTNGSVLTVNEYPTGTAREWKYSTVTGGPYLSFGTPETGTTYTPNFATGGNYYVVAVSTISGISVTSNEVGISVNSVTLSTGTVTGSPFEFSANAPNASVSVPFTTSGNFSGGNTFTAQLSDASGSFASATNIGTLSAISSGSISATIPSSTPAGTGYRIRVIASSPSVLGNDNGTDLVVDQFNNSVAPSTTQTILFNSNGTAITVTASQSATHQWQYSTTSGGPYSIFSPPQTGTTYTPNFPTPGTYYVVAVSSNQHGDGVTSNEVQIDVTNGNTITTSAISGSPFLVSTSANVQVAVNFTSTAVFTGGNTFKAQLSDATGSFATPVEIGTLNGSTLGTINAVIPNSTSAGTGYRIRVVSTDPAITGSDNGANLSVVTFEVSLAPTDTQTIDKGTAGTTITASSTHPSTYLWQWTEASGLGYTNFSPSETNATYTPQFAAASTYYVICKLTNTATDVISSQEVVIIVQEPNGINETNTGIIKAYWNGNNFIADLSNSTLTEATLELVNANGQLVLQEKLNTNTFNSVATNLPQGVYIFRILGNGKVLSGKTSK
jgi:hypothetical protein